MSDDNNVTKESIRQRVWRYMEQENMAEFPRPVYNRIPNFKGAAAACDLAYSSLEEFSRATCVKVNPDKPQEQARYRCLEHHKTLLVPTPRLRGGGLLNRITPPPGASPSQLRQCSQAQGVKQHSVPVGLADSGINVDVVIIGAVAVSRKGHRLGKGEGFADLELAIMSSMGAITERTPIICTVHDCQVVDIPDDIMCAHDVPVDYIVTPGAVLRTDVSRCAPLGIIWEQLTRQKLEQCPVLKQLRWREGQRGVDTRLQHSTGGT